MGTFRARPGTSTDPGKPDSAGSSVTFAGQLSRPGGRTTALFGIVVAFAVYFLLTPWISLAVTAAAHALVAPDVPFADFRTSATRYETPAGLAANGVAIAALLVCCWLLMTLFHRAPFGQLSSVEQRLRPGYLVTCLAIAAVVVLGGTLVVGSLRGEPLQFAPQEGWWAFLVVVAIVTPWQSAAEEYLFRGYLLQAVTGVTTNPWIGVVASSLLFASLHGSQNAALLLDRFAFGMLASCLAILTGGLEAGIAAHIVNNVGAYSIAALTSSVAQLRATQEVTWADALTNLTIFAVFALAATAACRLLQLPRTTNYPLAQPNGPVAATRSPR